jgi:hypothetical protein
MHAGDGAARSHSQVLDHALEEIPALRAALDADGAIDPGVDSQGVDAAVAYLESYRLRAAEDIRRVRRFADGVPARVKIALAPEIRPGTPSLVALGRLASFLVTPQTILTRPARGASAATTLKGRAPLRGGRRADKSDSGIGRMPE